MIFLLAHVISLVVVSNKKKHEFMTHPICYEPYPFQTAAQGLLLLNTVSTGPPSGHNKHFLMRVN